MSAWKPCDRLTPDDFVRTKAWTTDLARAARDERFDDTWVRPVRAGDALDDDVYVSATLLDRDGRAVPRGVLRMRAAKRKGGSPVATALIVLGPYAATALDDDQLPLDAAEALRRLAPISYDVDVKLGAQHWKAKGRIRAPGVPEATPKVDDGEAKRQALIEAALARVTAAAAAQAAAPKAKAKASTPKAKSTPEPKAKAAEPKAKAPKPKAKSTPTKKKR